MKDAPGVHAALLVFVLPMEVAGGVKRMAVRGELKARLYFVRHMVVVRVASISVVPEAQKDAPTSA